MSLKVLRPGVRPFCSVLIGVTLLAMGLPLARGAEYYDNKSLGRRLASLAERNPSLVRVDNIALSMRKRKVWLIELGKGTKQDRQTRPAMLVVAGIEGNDLIGCTAAVNWIEQLAEQYQADADIAKLLQTTTIYIVPRLNPDSAKHFFARLKIETSSNRKPVDDDHDGLLDEDGPEDLNDDGPIISKAKSVLGATFVRALITTTMSDGTRTARAASTSIVTFRMVINSSPKMPASIRSAKRKLGHWPIL